MVRSDRRTFCQLKRRRLFRRLPPEVKQKQSRNCPKEEIRKSNGIKVDPIHGLTVLGVLSTTIP